MTAVQAALLAVAIIWTVTFLVLYVKAVLAPHPVPVETERIER